jgi:hypothetical protein
MPFGNQPHRDSRGGRRTKRQEGEAIVLGVGLHSSHRQIFSQRVSQSCSRAGGAVGRMFAANTGANARGRRRTGTFQGIGVPLRSMCDEGQHREMHVPQKSVGLHRRHTGKREVVRQFLLRAQRPSPAVPEKGRFRRASPSEAIFKPQRRPTIGGPRIAYRRRRVVL